MLLLIEVYYKPKVITGVILQTHVYDDDIIIYDYDAYTGNIYNYYYHYICSLFSLFHLNILSTYYNYMLIVV